MSENKNEVTALGTDSATSELQEKKSNKTAWMVGGALTVATILPFVTTHIINNKVEDSFNQMVEKAKDNNLIEVVKSDYKRYALGSDGELVLKVKGTGEVFTLKYDSETSPVSAKVSMVGTSEENKKITPYINYNRKEPLFTMAANQSLFGGSDVTGSIADFHTPDGIRIKGIKFDFNDLTADGRGSFNIEVEDINSISPVYSADFEGGKVSGYLNGKGLGDGGKIKFELSRSSLFSMVDNGLFSTGPISLEISQKNHGKKVAFDSNASIDKISYSGDIGVKLTSAKANMETTVPIKMMDEGDNVNGKVETVLHSFDLVFDNGSEIHASGNVYSNLSGYDDVNVSGGELNIYSSPEIASIISTNFESEKVGVSDVKDGKYKGMKLIKIKF